MAVKKSVMKLPCKPVGKASPAPKKKAKGHGLNAAQKAKLKRLYGKAVERAGEAEAGYALNMIRTKLCTLTAKDCPEPFLKQAELVAAMLRDSKKPAFKLDPQTRDAIAAALVYVVTPWGVIPDFIPGIGYLDDVYVLEMCVARIKPQILKYCKKKGINPADFHVA